MPSSISSSKRLKIALLVAVGVFALLGGLKWHLLKKVPASLIPMQESFWEEKAKTTQRYDVVIIGDSRVYRGVAPMAFAGSDSRVLNFGFSSGGMTGPLLEAGASKLDPCGKRIILLGVSPHSLTSEAGKNEHFKGCATAPDKLFQFSPFVQFYFSKEGTDLALKVLEGKIDGKRGYFQTPHEGGWIESYKNPSLPEHGVDKFREIFRQSKIDEQIVAGLMQQISEWKTQGIRVFGFRPPTNEDMERVENEHSGFDEAAFIGRLNESGGTWINLPDRFAFDVYDGSHLTGESAKQLSKQLAEAIQN